MSQLERDLAIGLALIKKRYMRGEYTGNDGWHVCSVGAAAQIVMGRSLSGGDEICCQDIALQNERAINILWQLALAVPLDFRRDAEAEGTRLIHDLIEQYNDESGKRATIAMWKEALETERARIRQHRIDQLSRLPPLNQGDDHAERTTATREHICTN